MKVDKIREIIDDYSWDWPDDVRGIGGAADKMLQWLNRCYDLTRKIIESEESAEEVYWQTLFAYLKDCNQPNFPPDPVLGLKAHKIRLSENRDRVPLAQTALSPADLKALAPALGYLVYTMAWEGILLHRAGNNWPC
jgi:hypothetical protein